MKFDLHIFSDAVRVVCHVVNMMHCISKIGRLDECIYIIGISFSRNQYLIRGVRNIGQFASSTAKVTDYSIDACS